MHHCRPARTQKGYRTPVQGNVGFPDLALARAGVLILAELKVGRGKPTLEQQAWLREAGPYARLWYPDDWPTILAELSTPRHTGYAADQQHRR